MNIPLSNSLVAHSSAKFKVISKPPRCGLDTITFIGQRFRNRWRQVASEMSKQNHSPLPPPIHHPPKHRATSKAQIRLHPATQLNPDQTNSPITPDGRGPHVPRRLRTLSSPYPHALVCSSRRAPDLRDNIFLPTSARTFAREQIQRRRYPTLPTWFSGPMPPPELTARSVLPLLGRSQNHPQWFHN